MGGGHEWHPGSPCRRRGLGVVCGRPAPFRGLSPPEARRILTLGHKSAQVNYSVLLND